MKLKMKKEVNSMTISQGLGWMKTLRERHQELVSLRNQNSHSSERLFGDAKTVIITPTYDVKQLDKLVNGVAMEIRKLDEALKEANATLTIPGYEKNPAVLGELN